MPTLAFVATRHNLNSIAALTGALEVDPQAAGVSLTFLWKDSRLTSRLRDLASKSDSLIVALSCATADLPEVQALVSSLRGKGFTPPLVAGGPHPSACPEDLLRAGADAVVIGEGEAVLPSLVRRIFAGDSPVEMPGVATLADDGSLIRGRRPRPVDLDDYPPMGVEHGRFAPVEITRGCPCACTFCQTPFLFGGRMRHRSVDCVVAWVRRAMEAGYSYVRFVTPNALAYQSCDNGRTANLGAIEHLLEETGRLVGKDQVYFGTFPSEVGPELVTPEAVDVIRRRSANDNVILGAQTGSERLLKTLRRRHTVADVYSAVEALASGGLKPVVDIILGLPGEEPDDLAATVRLVGDVVAMGAVIHTHTFMPLPGTPLADAPAGRVDPALHPLLDRLASEGKQIGQWRRQEKQGRRRRH